MSLVSDTPSLVTAAGFPTLAESDVRRANTLLGEHRAISFPWMGKTAVLRFVRRTSFSVAELRIRLVNHTLTLGLPTLPEPASFGAAFAGIEIAALPADLVLGVLDACFEEPIKQLQRHGATLQLQAWDAEPVVHPQTDLGWEVAWDGQPPFLSGSVSGDPAALDCLVELVRRVPARALGREGDLRIRCSLAAASLQIPIAEVSRLTAGDVLLIDRPTTAVSSGIFEFWSDGRRLGSCRRDGTTFQFITMNASSDSKRPASDLSAPPAAGSLRVDDLSVQLVFEVGQLDLPVDQVRTLREGYAFELPGVAEQVVTIRANGREIGRGELVEINDKLGVRITTWWVS